MSAFAYARSGNADVELAVQLASLIDAGCSDIAIDRTHGRHPRDLRRRSALLKTLGPGDTILVYRLDCLASRVSISSRQWPAFAPETRCC